MRGEWQRISEVAIVQFFSSKGTRTLALLASLPLLCPLLPYLTLLCTTATSYPLLEEAHTREGEEDTKKHPFFIFF